MTQARFNQQQIEILNHHGHGKDFHWKSRSSVITHLSSMSVDFAIFPLSFLPLYIRLLSLHYPITFSFSFFLPPLFSSLGRFIVLSLDTKDGFPPTALWSKTEKKTEKIDCPTSKGVSEVREQSEQGGTSKGVSGASERENGRASGPVLQSWF